MLYVIEEIEERQAGVVAEYIIYGLVGKTSKQLLGIVMKSLTTSEKRTIYFHDIDKMKQILESMSSK
jgi:hypothetical protein